jgi:uncharacterized membrane protein YhaH (DUF805 family)
MFSPLEGWFSLAGSRKRAIYPVTILAVAIVLGAFWALVVAVGMRDEPLLYTQLSLAATALIVLVLVSAQRLRDAGLPGLLALVLPIPAVLLRDDPVMVATILGAAILLLSILPGRTVVSRPAQSGKPIQLR